VEELNNVMSTLKKEKEEHYRESRRDKEVMERILSDLEASFAKMQAEREDSLTQAKSSTELLSTELSRLHDQLENSKGDAGAVATQGQHDRQMLGRLVKDLEDQLASALKTKSQADMMLQAQKSSHEKEVEKLNTTIDGVKKEYEELKEQSRAEKEVLGRMIKDVEEQCATAIREKAHLESMLNQATGDRSDLEYAREEYKAMVDEIRQDKEEAIQRLRDEKDYLAREIKSNEDQLSEKDAKIKTLEENNSVLQTSQLQLTDLRKEYQALARDFNEMQKQLNEARKRLAEVEGELAGAQQKTAEQLNELRYQLVHARADKEEVMSKSEHDKAKMYGILKELEAQLREATGGDPGANVTRMMGEFTDTMGQPAQSDGNLYAAMKEYEDKLIAAEQENAALRNQLGALGKH